MQTVALIVVLAAGLWLVGVAFLMALRPRYCLHLFGKMSASLQRLNWRLQITEQGLRILAGAALIVRAPMSKLPVAFEITGWLLVISSLLILAAPIGWHGAYGYWWFKRLRPWAIRLCFPFPAVVGAAIVYSAFWN